MFLILKIKIKKLNFVFYGLLVERDESLFFFLAYEDIIAFKRKKGKILGTFYNK